MEADRPVNLGWSGRSRRYTHPYPKRVRDLAEEAEVWTDFRYKTLDEITAEGWGQGTGYSFLGTPITDTSSFQPRGAAGWEFSSNSASIVHAAELVGEVTLMVIAERQSQTAPSTPAASSGFTLSGARDPQVPSHFGQPDLSAFVGGNTPDQPAYDMSYGGYADGRFDDSGWYSAFFWDEMKWERPGLSFGPSALFGRYSSDIVQADLYGARGRSTYGGSWGEHAPSGPWDHPTTYVQFAFNESSAPSDHRIAFIAAWNRLLTEEEADVLASKLLALF